MPPFRLLLWPAALAAALGTAAAAEKSLLGAKVRTVLEGVRADPSREAFWSAVSALAAFGAGGEGTAEAAAEIRSALRGLGDRPRLAAAAALSRLGLPGEAFQEASRVLGEKKAEADLQALAADVLGTLPAAFAERVRALPAGDRPPEVRLCLARAALRLWDDSAARETLAGFLSSPDVRLRRAAALALAEAGDAKRALPVLREVAKESSGEAAYAREVVRRHRSFLDLLADPWVLFGFAGQALFFGRFFVQWLASERKQRIVIPVAFWYLSLAGGLVLFIYAARNRDLVIMTGQACGVVIYLRSLILHYRPGRTGDREGG